MKNFAKILTALLFVALLMTVSFAAPSAITVSDSADEVLPPENVVLNEVSLLADGSESMPYTISTAQEFNTYADLVNTSNASYADKYYKLTGNIDFTDVTMVPFGTSSTAPFKGTLDGNGYAILNVTVPDTYYSGVVGYMTQGTIKDLRVEYAEKSARESYTAKEKYYFGGVLGYAQVASSQTVTITNCETSGKFFIHSGKALYAGGLIGYIKCESGNAAITNCVSHMSFDIEGDVNSYVGGFAAYVVNGSGKNCAFEGCVSYGDVNVVLSSIEATVGGFCGYVTKDESGWSSWASDEDASLFATDYEFENCVAYGNVYAESQNKTNVGGFVAQTAGSGTLEMSNCYRNASQTIDGSGVSYTVGSLGTGTTQENLNNPEFYSSVLGFDFANKWFISGSRLHIRNVAKSYGAASLSGTKDLRLSSKSGLRFKSDIDVFKRDYGYEYGFIIARADELGDSELTFDYTGRIITGVAYDGTTDIFLDANDEYITFTGVVHSIPENGYATELVARTYIKFVCDGETVVVYGDTTRSSINESAEALKNSESYEYLTEAQKEVLETMLLTA